MTKESKGYLLALGSYASSAIGTIASKWLIGYTSAATTAFMWFLGGTIVTSFLLLALQGGINWRSIRSNGKVYLEISLIMAVAALAYFVSIDLAGPSIIAFVQQLGVVFGVVLGAVVLHERIDWLDWIGGGLAIVGALVISYRAESRVEMGVLFILINCIGVAIQNLLVKQHIQTIDKLELVFVRSVIAAAVIFTFAASTGSFVTPKTWLLPGFFFGSFFGYVAVNLLLYQALGRVDLAQVSILSVSGAPMIMAGSIFAFHDIPTTIQLVGCGLILIGVAFIVAKPMLPSHRTALQT